ncbi:MAG TPA: zinc ribbon domain-containing protein, partial [Anaerolineales bacterium]|nr:zinc ribbon domain-containing protein [Anaerolineales bacterium]
MAETIICPVCGEINPADMEFCRNCQSRLHSLPGPLKEESEPILPGEPPTKKATSELEPLLPQWLRDARQKARDSKLGGAEDIESEPVSAGAGSPPDLLAGLASQQGDEDDEIPDWLASITGATSKKKKPATEVNQAKWVELGRTEKPAATPESETGTPPAGEQPAAQDNGLLDWFKQTASPGETADAQESSAPAAMGSTPEANQGDASS